MKLRYYLRGLGIGIVVTALIFVITPREKETLSDSEIRERAELLGMVDSSSLTLAAIQATAETDAEADDASGETKAVEEAETAGETESSGAEEPAETVESSGAEEPAETVEGSGAQTQPVTITIVSGANSYSVCKDLEAAGLIEDALDFDAYLCAIGYSKSINAGTYEIVPGSSQEDIAKIITRKR